MHSRDDNTCNYCEETDYIEHFFGNCTKLKPFWDLVVKHIYLNIGKDITISETDVLFGYKPNEQTRNEVNQSYHFDCKTVHK